MSPTEETESKEILRVDGLDLAGSPVERLQRYSVAAKALMAYISQSDNAVVFKIPGARKDYLGYDPWASLGHVFGVSARIVEVRRVPEDETKPLLRYHASAIVTRVADGQILGGAEMVCDRGERNWNRSPEYALKSMAQTRALAKALRMLLSPIVVMAGYSPTPYEEMAGLKANGRPHEQTREKVPKAVEEAQQSNPTVTPTECKFCGAPLTLRESSYGLWSRCDGCGSKWDEKRGWMSPRRTNGAK